MATPAAVLPPTDPQTHRPGLRTGGGGAYVQGEGQAQEPLHQKGVRGGLDHIGCRRDQMRRQRNVRPFDLKHGTADALALANTDERPRCHALKWRVTLTQHRLWRPCAVQWSGVQRHSTRHFCGESGLPNKHTKGRARASGRPHKRQSAQSAGGRWAPPWPTRPEVPFCHKGGRHAADLRGGPQRSPPPPPASVLCRSEWSP